MSTRMQALYQQILLDHNRNPRNFGALAAHTHHAKGDNPLCGDNVEIFLQLDAQEHIEQAGFDGAACAIATASASMLTEAVKGKSATEALALFTQFHAMLTSSDSETDKREKLGDLTVFEGLSAYPSRIKCATLAWYALKAALEQQSEPVTTE